MYVESGIRPAYDGSVSGKLIFFADIFKLASSLTNISSQSLHGGHVESWNDGHPQSWYTDVFGDGTVDHGIRFADDPNNPYNISGEQLATGTHVYNNDQNAAMLFYHDHAMGITRLNVYAGLAGLYIIGKSHHIFDSGTCAGYLAHY